MIVRILALRSLAAQRRLYSSQRPGFFSQFLDNIKQDMAKNKEMKQSLKKFREEAQRLEQSDALKQARTKFENVEAEATKGSQVLKKNLDSLKGKVTEVLEEAGKTDIAKKAGELKEELRQSARGAAESLSETGQKIGRTGAFRTLSRTAEAVKEELDQAQIGAGIYRPPKKLRRRIEVASMGEDRAVRPDNETLGIELHKDSKFFQSWEAFKENNPYLNKVLDWKTKYDESDNPLIRASRVVTERVSDLVGGLFQKTELSEALTEICKLDPGFDKLQFLKDCETDIIPNILEAMIRGELEILRDWCHEGPFNLLAATLKPAKDAGYHFCSKILDIDNVDLVMGKVMEQGPVLVINFTSQQILCLRNSSGTVVEGDPDKILRVSYVWVLCRDPQELNPKAAWRLLDLASQSSEQFL